MRSSMLSWPHIQIHKWTNAWHCTLYCLRTDLNCGHLGSPVDVPYCYPAWAEHCRDPRDWSSDNTNNLSWAELDFHFGHHMQGFLFKFYSLLLDYPFWRSWCWFNDICVYSSRCNEQHSVTSAIIIRSYIATEETHKTLRKHTGSLGLVGFQFFKNCLRWDDDVNDNDDYI